MADDQREGAAGPAQRLPRAGDRLDGGRPVLRPHAGRFRRRGDQGRARPTAIRCAPWASSFDGHSLYAASIFRNKKLISLDLHQRGGPRPRPRARRQVRRAGRELQAGHAGEMGPRLGRPVAAQSAPRHGAHLGLRPGRPLLAPAGLRRGLRGGQRPAPSDRRSRPRARRASACR